MRPLGIAFLLVCAGFITCNGSINMADMNDAMMHDTNHGVKMGIPWAGCDDGKVGILKHVLKYLFILTNGSNDCLEFDNILPSIRDSKKLSICNQRSHVDNEYTSVQDLKPSKTNFYLYLISLLHICNYEQHLL